MNYFKILVFILLIILNLTGINILYNVLHSDFQTKRNQFAISAVPLIKIIHQSWKDVKIPKQFTKFTESWIDYCFENWAYYLWTDEDNLNLVTLYYPWLLKRYISFPREINRADISRYIYMHKYGGIYTDLDNECLIPFDNLLKNHSIVFGAMNGQFRGTTLKEGLVQNSFFYSIPGHRFWLELLELINENSGNDIPEIETGPVRLSNFIRFYLEQNSYDRNIRIYEPVYFNPFSWLSAEDFHYHCKDKGQMTENDWRICKFRMKAKGAFVVQYHAHLWF